MKYFLIALCLLVICSCKRKAHPTNEITKIEFARSGAWSDWGAAISIDNTLQYKYYGGVGHVRHYYVGKVTPQFWDTLNRKLSNIDFKKVRPDDDQRVADANYYEMIVYWKNKKRRIVRMGFVITDSLSRIASWIDNSYKKIKLVQVPNAIKFETTFQNPPPMPKIDRVRFPPPVNR